LDGLGRLTKGKSFSAQSERIKSMKIFKSISAAAILVICLSGCYKTETDEAIVIIGDSLGMQFQSILSTRIQMRDNAPLVITNSMGGMAAAYESAHLYWAGRVREVQKITNISTLIVSLGSNDGTLYGLAGTEVDLIDQFPGAINSIVESAQGATVFWVIPSDESSMYYNDGIREMLQTASDVYPNLTLVEIGGGGLAEDNIHLSPEGQESVNDQLMVLMGYE
jgi:hypothetical protein